MNRILLLCFSLLLSIPAITGMCSFEKQFIYKKSFVSPSPSSVSEKQGAINDDQFQQAVPHKTPRRLSSLRRRFINTTVDVYTATNFCLSHLGWGWNQWHLAKRHTVFNFLGGEAAFLFRLTPF